MYTAPLRDIQTALWRMADAGRLAKTELFAEATEETADAVLTEAGRLAAEKFAPLRRDGDVTPAALENGVVRTSPGFKEAYHEMASGGWVGMTSDPEHGGMGLPLTFQAAMNEMLSGANLALSLCPMLSYGAIEAIESHGTEEQKALYLPKLNSGVWTGTMNLTEPHCGTDVGALRTKAQPQGDGSYSITGSKIWITWGDSDCAENTVHLVLARLPGAPEGSAGISLFLVPKYLPSENGEAGVANDLKTVSLEEKLGIHGSPTCVMAYEGAKGWLIGRENKGLACMFTMMNNARLNVGLQGVGIAEAATQHALAFARERVQGHAPVENPTGTIIDHADVRRMLMTMRALTNAARSVAYECAVELDLAKAADDAAGRARAKAMGAFLTPLAKAWGTETGVKVADIGLQLHGSAGFVEETGAAQYLRDVRITPIYEGTNGVQAMDLVGRKLSMDGGETALRAIAAARTVGQSLIGGGGPLGFLSSARGDKPLALVGAALVSAAEDAETVTKAMLDKDMVERGAGAAPYLRLMAMLQGGKGLARAAAAGGETDVAIARFYAGAILPETGALRAAALSGGELLYALTPEAMDAA